MARFKRAMAAAMVLPIMRFAHAEGRSAEVAFEAPTTCGNAESFAERVGARASRAVLASKVARHRVAVVKVGAGFRGTYRVVDARGPERRIDAARCSQVVDALALVVAMALDEEREDARAAAGDDAVRAPMGDAAGSNGSAPASSSDVTTPDAPSPSSPLVDEAPVVEAPRVSIESAGTWAILDASGAVGVALGAGFVPPRADYWVPAIHGALAWQGASRRTTEGGSADLHWWFLAPRACLARTPWREALLELCGVAQIGTFEVVPSRVSGLARDSSMWLALGSGASLRSFVAPDVALDVGADFLAPVHRPLFATVTASGQTEEVYRASGVAMLASVRVVWIVR